MKVAEGQLGKKGSRGTVWNSVGKEDRGTFLGNRTEEQLGSTWEQGGIETGLTWEIYFVEKGHHDKLRLHHKLELHHG